MLLVCVVFGCSVEDDCLYGIIYEERIPLFIMVEGKMEFDRYIVYNETMTSCDCLLLANQEAGKYYDFLESLDPESDLYNLHEMYPKYIQCK